MKIDYTFKVLLVSIIMSTCNYLKQVEAKTTNDYRVSKEQLKKIKPYLFIDTLELQKLSNDNFLERIQFDYTMEFIKKLSDTVLTIEKEGYAINLFCVGIKNGWFHRNKTAKVVLEKLLVYEKAKHIQGFFPRSFSKVTGDFIPGSKYGDFGQPYDVVGTAFLATSLKFIVKQFFNRNNKTEIEIRQLCKKICNRINWDFAYKVDKKCFTWFKNGKNGEYFDGKDLVGEMDETYFLQLYVLGAKNWSHNKEAYKSYTSNIFIDNQYGYSYFSTKQYDYKNSKQFSGITVQSKKNKELDNYPTVKLGYLVQSHIWFDLRDFKDSLCIQWKMNYFQGVQNAIKAQIRYAKINPGNNYLYGDVWGFYDTFSPISKKWMVTGLPAEGDFDEGTIAISAVLSAINFMPDESISCIRALYNNFKNYGIYGNCGFKMSVNTNTKQTASTPDYFFLPINVLSIENYRSELLWNLAKKEKDYQSIFRKAI